MTPDQCPDDIRPFLIPEPAGRMMYECLTCTFVAGIDTLLYTCPECGGVLMLRDTEADRLRDRPADLWHRIFDYRKMLTLPALKGIYRYHEFIGPVLPLDAVVYLGEGHTPVIEANAQLQDQVGQRFFFKNDGQNPSASFKDRGMASALSYINHLIRSGRLSEVLAVCASTGDTSAAAALYAAYLQPNIKSAVLLPHGRVTPQQLSQPLGSGALVFEIPGVFDDCMKVVEYLSDHYNVALLNSKNPWRILGQESYSYEIAQEFNYRLADLAVVVPIGNAGNITAVMTGFIKFFTAGIIDALPTIIGVQSAHADPVFRYYQQPDPATRRFEPVTVKPSTAQAAMIGNPVSMPRVIQMAEAYNRLADRSSVFVVQVSEQEIMDWQLTANRNGHIACTHGGECLAGLRAARQQGLVADTQVAVVDSTAHALKFAGFQDMYFENRFPAEYEITPDPALINRPELIDGDGTLPVPHPGAPLRGDAFEAFVEGTGERIAERLALKSRDTS